MMLLEVMRECNNFFVVSEETGTFEIMDGKILLFGDYIKGQYIAIGRRTPNSPGSILNSGIYKIIDDLYTLERTPPVENEKFTGSVYGLSVPIDFIELAEKVKSFQDKQGTPSNNISESFGAYSESKATDSNGAVATWESVFRVALNKHRKMKISSEVRI